MSCLLTLVLNSCCNVCFCLAAVFHLNQDENWRKTYIYWKTNKHYLPPSHWLWLEAYLCVTSSTPCSMKLLSSAQIASACRVLSGTLYLLNIIPLLLSPLSEAVVTILKLVPIFFKGNRMTKTEIRLCYDASHPRREDIFSGAWLC